MFASFALVLMPTAANAQTKTNAACVLIKNIILTMENAPAVQIWKVVWPANPKILASLASIKPIFCKIKGVSIAAQG